ncbi:MAG: hypothetical protein ACM3SY_03560 [Candidatus Omnitrophota bacterium]
MTKLRTTLKKKAKPPRNDRLLMLIGGGTMIVFIVLFLLILAPKAPSNKAEAMDKSLKYVKNQDGILAVKTYPEQNRAVIIYDSYKKNKDFVQIARFAGIRMSDNLGNIEVTLVLAKDKENQPVYEFVLKSGELIRESEKK